MRGITSKPATGTLGPAFMPRNATSLASWMRALDATLRRRGVASQPLFEQAGMDHAALTDPNARYPLAQTTRLWGLAVQATGDPCLGLDVARHINQTTFHALGYALLASPTLQDCFERLTRYFRIVSDAAELEFSSVDQDRHQFVIHALAGSLQPADEALDAMMAVVMRLCRALYGDGFRPAAVHLRRSPPPDTALFERVFRVPVQFDAEKTAMFIAADLLQAALPTANAELARHNDEILARHLANLDRDNIANRVHAELVERLPQGEPSQEAIAESLHMSLRNLQRRLSEQDTSYKAILNRTRQDLATSYMANDGYSISEIAYLLGFSDTSSFSRAFKRWTGQSPRQYRETG